MALRVKKTESNAAVDPGEYLAAITEVAEGFHSEYKENYEWKIKIKDATLDGEAVDNGGELVELRFFTGRRWTNNEKNKLNQLLQAVGESHEIGDELDLEKACLGKRLRVIITDKKTEKGTFSKVSGFLPVKKSKKTEKEKPAEKEVEKKEKKSSSSDDGLFNFSGDD